MRIFTNESIWDAENQEWCEVYFIDGQRVSVDEYNEQLEVEESVADENLEVNDCENEVSEEVCECTICTAEREIESLECCCNECVEDHMKDFIDECLERVFNGCPECIVDSVVKLAFKCLNLGKENVKQEMYEFLED
jgi:hypothetical protein